jgi:hypothetical protein
MRGWHGVGTSSGYSEKVFPNKKVGHAELVGPGMWVGSLDGVYCGRRASKVEAQKLVDREYERLYGG